jgi:hypothetical protein
VFTRCPKKRFDAARLKILLAIPLLRTAQATRSASAVLLLDKSVRPVCLASILSKVWHIVFHNEYLSKGLRSFAHGCCENRLTSGIWYANIQTFAALAERMIRRLQRPVLHSTTT